jgi:hypothetical protein
MKIVKFKDGTYGIRWISLFTLFSYKFLSKTGDFFWWGTYNPEYARHYKMRKDEVIKRFAEYKKGKEKIDIGTPVEIEKEIQNG